jgi:hypothetical protein
MPARPRPPSARRARASGDGERRVHDRRAELLRRTGPKPAARPSGRRPAGRRASSAGSAAVRSASPSRRPSRRGEDDVVVGGVLDRGPRPVARRLEAGRARCGRCGTGRRPAAAVEGLRRRRRGREASTALSPPELVPACDVVGGRRALGRRPGRRRRRACLGRRVVPSRAAGRRAASPSPSWRSSREETSARRRGRRGELQHGERARSAPTSVSAATIGSLRRARSGCSGLGSTAATPAAGAVVAAGRATGGAVTTGSRRPASSGSPASRSGRAARRAPASRS